MTSTMSNQFPIESPSRWNVLFAEDADRDLDFDEGFEEDELHQSKPPSRRPLLWILLLLLVGAIAYWSLNNQSRQMPETTAINSVQDTASLSPIHTQSDIGSPLFRENQTVVLVEKAGEALLTEDATNSRPGPIVKADERLTILDGSHQKTGWIYLVKTTSGKTGWIPEDKLRQPF